MKSVVMVVAIVASATLVLPTVSQARSVSDYGQAIAAAATGCERPNA